MQPARRKRPTVTDKLVLWERAYQLVLATMYQGAPPTTADVVALRAAATIAAALLVQGVDADGDRA